MPTDRVQKNRSPENMPDVGDPDRKRVLNVLAQRRYRQRRREKIATLEAQAKNLEDLVDQQRSASSDDPSPQASLTSESSRSPDTPQTLPVNRDNVVELTEVPIDDGLLGFAVHEDLFSMALIQDSSDLANLPTPPFTSDLAQIQQTPTSSTFSFPMTADGGVLTMPVMSMVQAFMSIATALNLGDGLWDPSYMHVMPSSMLLHSSLPENLRPVPAQLIIPHHPALDLLPWPTMREKLICMLSMPSKLRPPVAREVDDDGRWPSLDGFGTSSSAGQSAAITQLVQDLDDFQDGGGLIVHGNSTSWGEGNEYVEEAWEVGESFYRKWWFCLDEKIVAQSNRRRKERGLGKLRLTS